MNTKFHFNDILITPRPLSDITSRSDINCYDSNGMLPIFTAPMYDVVDEYNIDTYLENKINPILPRGKNFLNAYKNTPPWKAYGLDEFIHKFLAQKPHPTFETKQHILIDIANGHMKKLYNTAKEAKEIYGDDLVLMVGNIANPETYKLYSEIGVDYIRVGIGNGCFIDGTKIKTDKGLKNIEDVEVGDKVLTHKNRYREVSETHRRSHTDNTIVINGEIECTPNHEFYVLHKKYKNIVNDENIHDLCEWKSAMELLKTSDYLLIENE